VAAENSRAIFTRLWSEHSLVVEQREESYPDTSGERCGLTTTALALKQPLQRNKRIHEDK
jgi:hypothetical protein